MVNEEDHLRIFSLEPGFQPSLVLKNLLSLEQELEQHLEFAYSKQLGFLSACPTNTGTGLRASDDVDSVSGSIFIERGGHVDGDVSTVSGGIGLVGTEVTGNVGTVSGDITVGVGSYVHGDVRVRKSSGTSWIRIGTSRTPRIVIGPDAVVDGDLDFEHEVRLYVHESARTGAITGATPIPFSTARAPRRRCHPPWPAPRSRRPPARVAAPPARWPPAGNSRCEAQAVA